MLLIYKLKQWAHGIRKELNVKPPFFLFNYSYQNGTQILALLCLLLDHSTFRKEAVLFSIMFPVRGRKCVSNSIGFLVRPLNSMAHDDMF